MEHGNDPLRMLRELAMLGTLITRVDAGKVPSLAALDPEVCHMSWQIELRSAAERAAIEQIFEWAEGECTLSIEPLSPPASAARNAAATPVAPVAPQAAAPAAAAATAPAAPAAPPAAAASKAPPVPTPSEAARSGSGEGGSIRVGIEKIDELLNAVGELVITQSVCSQLAAVLEGRQADELRNALVQFERHMRSLQESVMRVRMLPIGRASCRERV